MILKKKNILAFIFCWSLVSVVTAQEKTNDKPAKKKLEVTTGVGINKTIGPLHRTFRSTVGFNSGVEKTFNHNWFLQLDLNINSVKYYQRIKADNSSFLFQKTNSSVFIAGLNGGKNFELGKSSLFLSVYGGSGYISVGEPRITVDVENKIATQEVVTRTGILAKTGTRLGLHTNIKFLQTIYLDGSIWASSLKTQGSKLNGAAVFIGMRMSMN